ncbi:MAG: hypothetical protein AAF655_19130 [Bacteroidota bacterium]
MNLRNLFTLLILTLPFSLVAQGVSETWQSDLETVVEEFKTCVAPEDNLAQCHNYLDKALEAVYGVNAFYSEQKQRFLTGNEIVEFLQTNANWEPLGNGSDAQALQDAQDQANLGKAVVAAYSDPAGAGHIALILPGKTSSSGKWQAKVPNAASLFMDNHARSFVGKPLSYSFKGEIRGEVLLYTRK